MGSKFMTERVKSSTAGLWAVTGLLEPRESLGKVSGVVTGLVGQNTDSQIEMGQTNGSTSDTLASSGHSDSPVMASSAGSEQGKGSRVASVAGTEQPGSS